MTFFWILSLSRLVFMKVLSRRHLIHSSMSDVCLLPRGTLWDRSAGPSPSGDHSGSPVRQSLRSCRPSPSSRTSLFHSTRRLDVQERMVIVRGQRWLSALDDELRASSLWAASQSPCTCLSCFILAVVGDCQDAVGLAVRVLFGSGKIQSFANAASSSVPLCMKRVAPTSSVNELVAPGPPLEPSASARYTTNIRERLSFPIIRAAITDDKNSMVEFRAAPELHDTVRKQLEENAVGFDNDWNRLMGHRRSRPWSGSHILEKSGQFAVEHVSLIMV